MRLRTRRITRRTRASAVVLALTGLLYFLPSSQAVPMWTRRYNVPCSMCHAYPSLQLTDGGLDFLRRGHRFEGDSFDKDLFHLISAHVEWDYEVQKREATPFSSPEFHIHAGGALARMFSAYVDAGVGSESELETARLQFTKESGDTYFTARAGKFIPALIRNYGGGLMSSASTPLVLTDATLDDNPFTPARPSFGVDVAARLKRFFFQTGMVNGEDVEGQAAVANHKDVYTTAEVVLRDGLSGFGLYYHRGGYDLGDASAGFLFDRYDRQGLFGNFTRDKLRVGGAYVRGKDRIETLEDRKIGGYFVQFDVHPIDWLVPFVRYDGVKTTDETDEIRTRKGTLGCSIRLFENEITAGRTVLEVSQKREAGVNTNAALLGLLWSF